MDPDVKKALHTTAQEVLKPMVQGLVMRYDLDEKRLAEILGSVMQYTRDQTEGNAAEALTVFALCIMAFDNAESVELPPQEHVPS